MTNSDSPDQKPINQYSSQESTNESPQPAPTVVPASFRQFHQGPLPPPEILEEYKRILPGLEHQIADMANRALGMEAQVPRRPTSTLTSSKRLV